MSWHTDQKRMMQVFGQTTTRVDLKQAALYLNMMVEELGETLCAANPKESGMIKHHIARLHNFARVTDHCDPVEMLDGAVDVHVVTMGFGVSLNYDMDAAWGAVLSSNMAKVDPVTGLVIRNEAGKVQKPPGWTSPAYDLRMIARAAGFVVAPVA